MRATTHQRYFEFLLRPGWTPALCAAAAAAWGRRWAMAMRSSRVADARGDGRLRAGRHRSGRPEQAELEAICDSNRRPLRCRAGIQMTQTSRNLLIFPNLIINDIMAITVRTFFPVAPDYMEITAWALAPKDERPENRALRLDNFLTFLGPGWFRHAR